MGKLYLPATFFAPMSPNSTVNDESYEDKMLLNWSDFNCCYRRCIINKWGFFFPVVYDVMVDPPG